MFEWIFGKPISKSLVLYKPKKYSSSKNLVLYKPKKYSSSKNLVLYKPKKYSSRTRPISRTTRTTKPTRPTSRTSNTKYKSPAKTYRSRITKSYIEKVKKDMRKFEYDHSLKNGYIIKNGKRI